MAKLKRIRIGWISLTMATQPANGKSIVFKSQAPGAGDKTIVARIEKADATKHLIYAVVYEPDILDAQGDSASAEEIEKAAQQFLMDYRQAYVDTDHNYEPTGSIIVESFIVKGKHPDFPKTKDGAWCVVIKVRDVDLWSKVESGEVTGVSMAGYAVRDDEPQPTSKNTAEPIMPSFGEGTAAMPTTIERSDTMKPEEIKKAIEALTTQLKALQDKLDQIEKGTAAPAAADKGKDDKDPDELRKSIEAQKKEFADKIAELEKALASRRTGDDTTIEKALPMQAELVELREKIEKSGNSMTDLSLDGELPQAQALELIDMLVASDEFLTAVSQYNTDEHEQPLDFFELAQFVMQNSPEGSDPASYATGDNIGKVISLKETMCFVPMLRSIIVSARGRKGEQRLAARIPSRMAANIVQVGFQGMQHVATATAPADINVGWIKLIKDSMRTNIVDIGLYKTGATIDWVAYLNAMIAAMPDQFKSQAACEFIMRPSDYETLVKQVASFGFEANLLISGTIPTFGGYKIRRMPYMTAGEVLFTNPKNLCYGINTTINRTREYNALKRQVDYMITLNNGYQIGIDEAIVFGYDVTPGADSGLPQHLPAAVTFTDTDTDEGQIGGTVAITKATNESDLTHYVIYLGTGENTPVTELATLPKTGSNLSFVIGANTVKGANTYLLVYTKNANGLSATAYAIALTDVIAVPANPPAGVAFTDTDTDTGKIGGNIVITKASSETDVTHYALYFGTSTTVKTTEIATLPKTGGNITFVLPAGTVIGENTHILAYTKNAGGLCATPANVAISDVTE